MEVQRRSLMKVRKEALPLLGESGCTTCEQPAARGRSSGPTAARRDSRITSASETPRSLATRLMATLSSAGRYAPARPPCRGGAAENLMPLDEQSASTQLLLC